MCLRQNLRKLTGKYFGGMYDEIQKSNVSYDDDVNGNGKFYGKCVG